ncbi:MAG: FeoB-associated Cys-rich membrane protein [Pseudomonadota bacterium]|nr:FeoB-associated Cys-rich membrane protein [Pseudomonadota bacterium]
MSETVQMLIVAALVVLSLGYLLRRLWPRKRRPGQPPAACGGCGRCGGQGDGRGQ